MSMARCLVGMSRLWRVGKAEPLKIEAKVTSQTRQIISTRAEFLRPDGALIAEASAQQFLQEAVQNSN